MLSVSSKLKKADKILEKAMLNQPCNPTIYELYALSAEKQKNNEVAVNRWQIAIEKFPDNLDFHSRYSLCVYKLQHTDSYLINLINWSPEEQLFYKTLAKIDTDNIQINSDKFHIDALPYFLEKSYNFSQNVDVQPVLKAYWWDDRPNFGDWIGAWLLSDIAESNIYNFSKKTGSHIIYSVGSIIEHLNTNKHHNVKIWGSGLMRPINTMDNSRALKKIHQSNIMAVRGKKTLRELSEHMDFEIEPALGDPALLLPYIYQPNTAQKSRKNISIIPHYVHYHLFARDREFDNSFNIINVDNHPKKVVNQIVASDVVISSSLHGIIIAQAYKIPWIWLKIGDKPLTNDEHQDFKFFDFFSTMDNPDCFSQVVLSSRDINKPNIEKYVSQAKIMQQTDNFQSLIVKLKGFLYEENKCL